MEGSQPRSPHVCAKPPHCCWRGRRPALFKSMHLPLFLPQTSMQTCLLHTGRACVTWSKRTHLNQVSFLKTVINNATAQSIADLKSKEATTRRNPGSVQRRRGAWSHPPQPRASVS